MFVVYLIILLFSIVLLTYLSNKQYKQTNAFNNQFVDIQKFKIISNLPKHSLDLIVLGSNAPKFAFDFSEIKDLKCSNWAIGPETFEYDSIILKKFSSKLKQDATVILPICPGSFFLHKFSHKNNLVKYYKLLNPKEFPEYSIRQKIKEYDYPLIFNPMLTKRLIKDVKEDKRLDLDYNLINSLDIQKDAEWWIRKCWNPLFGINIEDMHQLSSQNEQSIINNINIVKKIAEYCQEYKLNLILVYLPLTKELADMFPESYVNQYMKQCSENAIKDFNVKIVDYMHDKRFQKHEYYINSFFMNRIGAKLFTNTFIKENIR